MKNTDLEQCIFRKKKLFIERGHRLPSLVLGWVLYWQLQGHYSGNTKMSASLSKILTCYLALFINGECIIDLLKTNKPSPTVFFYVIFMFFATTVLKSTSRQSLLVCLWTKISIKLYQNMFYKEVIIYRVNTLT